MRDTVLIGLLAPVFAATMRAWRQLGKRRVVIEISSTPVVHGTTVVPQSRLARAEITARAA